MGEPYYLVCVSYQSQPMRFLSLLPKEGFSTVINQEGLKRTARFCEGWRTKWLDNQWTDVLSPELAKKPTAIYVFRGGPITIQDVRKVFPGVQVYEVYLDKKPSGSQWKVRQV